MSDANVIVTMKHLRLARMCNREPRVFCERHGISWSDFVTNGLPAQVLLDTGDHFALKVVEIARKDYPPHG